VEQAIIEVLEDQGGACDFSTLRSMLPGASTDELLTSFCNLLEKGDILYAGHRESLCPLCVQNRIEAAKGVSMLVILVDKVGKE